MSDQTIVILLLLVGVCFLASCISWFTGHIFGYLKGYDQGIATGRLIERALGKNKGENK